MMALTINHYVLRKYNEYVREYQRVLLPKYTLENQNKTQPN